MYRLIKVVLTIIVMGLAVVGTVGSVSYLESRETAEEKALRLAKSRQTQLEFHQQHVPAVENDQQFYGHDNWTVAESIPISGDSPLPWKVVLRRADGWYFSALAGRSYQVDQKVKVQRFNFRTGVAWQSDFLFIAPSE